MLSDLKSESPPTWREKNGRPAKSPDALICEKLGPHQTEGSRMSDYITDEPGPKLAAATQGLL